jgi:L-ascorbate metabolism protein UlaG (beta-lactamase superfamily)
MLTLTYIGGPTALLEIHGLRLLTDPTFDPAGTEYVTSVSTLRKTESPAIPLERLGRVDGVLRKLLASAGTVLATVAAAQRLKGNAIGLANWQHVELQGPGGQVLQVTGTPARHGPVGGDRGPVTGFVLTSPDARGDGVYVSGDTVWYEGVEEVARRFKVTVAVLFLGAAVVPHVGPDHLTMTAVEAVLAARVFGEAAIVPLHFAGWQHFSESRSIIQQTFAAAGLNQRLRWPEPGVPTSIGP